MRTLLLDVGSGDDFSGQMEPFTEIVEALRGEGVVIVLPREAGLEVAARGEGLAGLDHLLFFIISLLSDLFFPPLFLQFFGVSYVEILGVNVAMLGKVEVLLGHEYALYIILTQ